MDYKWYHGKTRDVLQLSETVMAMVQTDRQSAFDRHICDIPYKGHVLTEMAAWWFQKIEEEELCKTHYLSHKHNVMFVKPCKRIYLEIIVRGYITGNTPTSMWTHYNNGVRKYCGIELPEGYVKNQKLDQPIITPTTKGDNDELISCQEIIDQKYLTQDQLDLISVTSMMLYKYGCIEADKRGLLLVDTKYEFGFDEDGHILVIDEVHTCDSSRYWIKDTYQERFNTDDEPEKYDKDIVRYWLKENKDQPIPKELIEKTSITYIKFYERLCQRQIEHHYEFNFSKPKRHFDGPEQELREIACEIFNSCVILCGSYKDIPHCNKVILNLDKHIVHNLYVCSVYKKTDKLLALLKRLREYGSCVFVTVAGMSNTLSGVVACNSILPVIACPPMKDELNMLINIHSSLQCPSNVPVMTVLSPTNTAQCVLRILSLN